MFPALLADGYGWDHMGRWGWGMAVTGWVFMALLIGLVAWLMVSSTRHGSPQAHESSRFEAIDTLDRRYARGEIDRDEYLARMEDLEK